jgi:hypothetical protein
MPGFIRIVKNKSDACNISQELTCVQANAQKNINNIYLRSENIYFLIMNKEMQNNDII